jgi:hypothetical protein
MTSTADTRHWAHVDLETVPAIRGPVPGPK